MSDDFESQENELIALESIYDINFIRWNFIKYSGQNSKQNAAALNLSVNIPDLLHVIIKSSENAEEKVHQISVKHLPSICLNFSYPKDYPSSSKPQYEITCPWLQPSQIALLCAKLDSIWQENIGSEIIFTWSQFLIEETFDALNITDTLILEEGKVTKSSKNYILPQNKCSDCEIFQNSSTYMSLDSSQVDLVVNAKTINNVNSACDTAEVDSLNNHKISLLQILTEYDSDEREKIFSTKTFLCKVCFREKSGSACIEFWPCSHVYCKICMQSYFEVQINDGNIKLLRCPEINCDSEAAPKQVEKLVSKELYQKWDQMLLNSTLSSLGDIQNCPRKHCQYPVTIVKNIGECPSCDFVFCGLCRFGSHGLENCKFKSGEAKKILDQYMNGSEETKSRLEVKYGQKYLQTMVNEFLSINYIEKNAKECPKCRSNIEKIEGCNKMSCKNCHCAFCWLCEKMLDPRNPYSHFNVRGTDCYNALFNGVGHEYGVNFPLVDSSDEDDFWD